MKIVEISNARFHSEQVSTIHVTASCTRSFINTATGFSVMTTPYALVILMQLGSEGFAKGRILAGCTIVAAQQLQGEPVPRPVATGESLIDCETFIFLQTRGKQPLRIDHRRFTTIHVSLLASGSSRSLRFTTRANEWREI